VNCSDSLSAHTDTFHFNTRVFLDKEDFNTTAYSTIISPLVKKAALGHNTLAVIGGHASHSTEEYLLSSAQTRGMLLQATSQLLNSIPITAGNSGKKDGTVTLSWYMIGVDAEEQVLDVLKAASAGDNSQPSDAEELHVRELDAGRGTSVPGLWEVELSASGDVDAVMTHVQRICQLADHSDGTSHAVVQLAVTSEKTKLATRGISNSHDLAGMGKITFLLLSNLEGNLMPSWASNTDSQQNVVLQRYPWVDQLGQLLQWIESKHAAGALRRDTMQPYQKSRLCLILNDAIKARQDSALLILLQPTEDNMRECHQWLQLSDNINTACMYYNAVNKAFEADTHGAKAHGSQGAAAGSARGRTASPFRGPSNDTTTASFRSSTPSAGNYDYTHPEYRQLQTHQAYQEGTQLQTLPPRTTPVRGSSGSATKPHSLLPQGSASTPRASTSSALKSGAANNASRYQSPASKATPSGNNNTTPQAYGYDSNQGGDSVLERNRNEIASLTQALAIKSEQLLQSQLAYDVLVKELHEDGSTLKAKDKERYKQVLAELRDYEIYRDVMETALTRMQAEVENLQNENKQYKLKIAANERDARKREDFKDQYSKDLTTTRKQLADAYERAVRDEATYKRLAKEKEELRVLQVALKNDRQRLVKENEMQTMSIADMKKRVILMEAKESQALRDVDLQKKAQEKLMDKMMSYQEENELLKAALTEMLEQAAQPPPPPPIEVAPAPASPRVLSSAAKILGILTEEDDEEEANSKPKKDAMHAEQAEHRRIAAEAAEEAKHAAKHAHVQNRRELFKTAPSVLESVQESKAPNTPPPPPAKPVEVKKSAFSRRQTLLGKK